MPENSELGLEKLTDKVENAVRRIPVQFTGTFLKHLGSFVQQRLTFQLPGLKGKQPR